METLPYLDRNDEQQVWSPHTPMAPSAAVLSRTEICLSSTRVLTSAARSLTSERKSSLAGAVK